MIIEATTKIGGKVFKYIVEEKNDMEAMFNAITLSSPRRKCDNCGDVGFDNKYFTANKTKEGGFIYINVKCKCGARSKLGQLQDGGYFWHNYSLYDPKSKEDN